MRAGGAVRDAHAAGMILRNQVKANSAGRGQTGISKLDRQTVNSLADYRQVVQDRCRQDLVFQKYLLRLRRR
jgi:hypothetical protein